MDTSADDHWAVDGLVHRDWLKLGEMVKNKRNYVAVGIQEVFAAHEVDAIVVFFMMENKVH